MDSSQLASVFLKPNRDEAVKRLHPWIFSGAIARTDGLPQDGDVVEVCDHRGNYVATGHFHNGSIAVKIISYERLLPDVAFWQRKLQNAKLARSIVAFAVHESVASAVWRGHDGTGQFGILEFALPKSRIRQ